MKHAIYRVTTFRIVGPYTLALEFDDGMSRTIDFRPVLEGELYGPLQNQTLFEGVRIDSEVRTLVWPNGADFDPATLHDWPEASPRLVAMARRWASAASRRST
jgi:hypothetical protein